MNANVDLGLTIEAWAEITIKEFHKKIEYFGIGDTGNLANSFAHHIVTAADGDPQKIIFAFNFYGKFVDWGVGNGTDIQDMITFSFVDTTHRRPKPWYTDTFFKQIRILKHLLEEKYARKSQLVIVKNASDNWDPQQYKI